MKRALIIAEDAEHADELRRLLEEHDTGEVIVQVDPTNDIGTHESLHRLAALGTLAASAAHEANNLLTYVSVSLDRLARGDAGSRAPKLLAGARDCCQRMQGLLRGMTGFARPGAREQALVRIDEIIDEAVSLVRAEIEGQAELVVDREPDLPILRASPAKLGQVFVNLLINAVQALDPAAAGARVSVRVTRDESGVRVNVEDTGAGIAPADLSRVFEAFYTTKPEGVGTGLGLFLSRSIVREHGGDIRITSEPGCGTTVSVRLPSAR